MQMCTARTRAVCELRASASHSRRSTSRLSAVSPEQAPAPLWFRLRLVFLSAGGRVVAAEVFLPLSKGRALNLRTTGAGPYFATLQDCVVAEERVAKLAD